MFPGLFRFEWRYHTRQTSFFAAALIYAAIGFVLTATEFGPANVHVNSPYSIAEALGLASLASVFALAVFCANAVVRDREHQMEEIVFTTRVGKRDYLLGRFSGSFLAAFTVFSATVAGMIAALAMPWFDPSRIGPFSIAAYVWPLLLLVFPGMLAAGVTLFAVATLTRSTIASVVGAVAIYVFYFIAAAFTNSPLMAASSPGADTATAAALLDPFGLSAFFEQTRFWTPQLRDTRLLSLSGTMLQSRLVWLAYSALVWTLVHRRYSMRVVGRTGGSSAAEQLPTHPAAPARVETVPPAGRPSQWKAFLAAAAFEIRSHLFSVPFILLTVLWAGLAAAEIFAEVTNGEYGSALVPETGLILPILAQPFALVAMVIIIYYSAETVWRERSVGMSEIVNATPAANGVFVVSKWAGLSSLVVVLASAGIAAGAAVQLARGYTRFEPALMIAFGWFMAAPLILFALLAVVIQTLSPQKYPGMLAVVAAAVITRRGDLLGLEHPLLQFFRVPDVEYSPMNGFGHYAAPFHIFLLLWSAAGGVLLTATAPFWRRATGDRSRALLRSIARGWSTGGRRIAAACLLIFAVTAALIFRDTNVLNRWSSSRQTLHWKADYERAYRAAESLPQPRISTIRGEVALFPRQRRVHVRGSCDLLNGTARAIPTVLVSIRREGKVTRLALAGARLEKHDERFGMWWFRFDRPLPPGGRTAMQFEIDYAQRGLAAADTDNSVVANGSFLFDQRCIPTVGYRKSYQIRNPGERKKRGLAPLPPETAGDLEAESEWVGLDLILSTDDDQIALTSGSLVRQWRSGDRRYFRYRSDGAVRHAIVFASARYSVARSAAGRIGVEVFYEPSHRENVARILAAASDSLRLFEERFGPYPHRVLRIAEAPSYWSFGGFATPGLIFLSENRAFLIDSRDPRRLDLVTRRTAHEVAHQWWGHTVAPVDVPGASMIVETLTKYSELLVLEEKDGPDSVRRSLERELDLYLAGRTSDEMPEVPLVRVTDQSYLYYRKGAIVMNAVRDLLGSSTLDRALREFAANYGGAAHRPTGEHLVAAIERAATAEQRVLIGQWMRDVVLYDVRLTAAKARPLGDGRFEVTLQVDAAKNRVDDRGVEHPLPFSERISIAILDAVPDGRPLYESKHPLTAGPNTLSIVVSKQPVLAVVDRGVTRIDRSRSDNAQKIAIAAPRLSPGSQP